MLAARIRLAAQPRISRPLALLGLVLAALLASGGARAHALSPPAPPPDPLLLVERAGHFNGEPHFRARFVQPGASAEVSWRICARECGDVVATGTYFRPGPLPVGAIVRAFATLNGQEVTASSPQWWGVPTPTALPGIDGELRPGRTVAPVGGRWVGGFHDDGSYFSYRLCRTASGEDCRAFRPATGSGDRITVDPAWAGWYLGSVEHRYGWGSVFPAIAYPGPAWGSLPGVVGDVVAGVGSAAGPLAGPIPAAGVSTPPSVRGTPRAGHAVRLRGGSWPDRPDAGAVWTGLRACPTRTDSDRCVALTDFTKSPGRPATADDPRPALNAPVRIDARYLGWYVGAVDLHVRDAAWGSTDVFRVMQGPDRRDAVPALSPVVVHGPLSRTPVRLGFTPRATIRTRAITHRTRRTTLATIRCTDRCVARATVVSGGRTTKVRLVADAAKAERLTVRARATRGQQARVTIRFDHHTRAVRKTVRLV